MAKEPSYPGDAPVGDPVGRREPDAPKAQEEKNDGGSGRTRQLVTAGAIGIGSAALVAALLYANRSRRNPKRD